MRDKNDRLSIRNVRASCVTVANGEPPHASDNNADTVLLFITYAIQNTLCARENI
jgi:hypothetical protein